MAATPAQLISQLATLLGLDDQSVKEQVWPCLSSMKTAQEVAPYLSTLLGSAPPQQAFIRSYLSARFPPPPPPPAPTTNWAKHPQALRAPAPSTSRSTVSAREAAAFEREFGGGGKVYVKSRDEEWVGKKGKSGSRTPATPPPGPAPGTGVPVRQGMPTTLARGMQKEPLVAAKKGATEGEVELSDGATKEILAVDRALRGFIKEKASTRSCFCQARQHSLSPYTPLCPRCGLVLCALNAPISPCPSCTHSPLLSPTSIATHISSLRSSRASILEREKRRGEVRREEEERERAAVRFPTLGVDGRPVGGPGTPRAYSNMAGAGPGLEERIARAYEEGKSVNGRPFGKKVEGKVLRLDQKTGKVRVQTKVVKKVVGKEGKDVVIEVVEEEDGEEAWRDDTDDGVCASRDDKLVTKHPDRLFFNVTLEEPPLWVEEVVLEEEVVAEEASVEAPRGVPGAAPVVAGAGGGKKGRTRVAKGGEVVV